MDTHRQRILQRLADSRNAAVERIAEAALAAATGDDLAQLVNLLIRRNKRTGWIALIRQFDRLPMDLQDRLLEHPKELFSPLSEAIGDHEGAGRVNVIEIIRKASDPRLVLLLIQALSDTREEVRRLAASSFVEAIRHHRLEGSEDPPDAYRLRRAVEFALQQYKTHKQDEIVLAGLMFERVQDGPIWPLFSDPHDALTRCAGNFLRALNEPALAGASLLALATHLKPAAIAGLAALDNPDIARHISRESYRLADPVLHRAAEVVTHSRYLDEVPETPPWTDDDWLNWARLIESLGLAAHVKFAWLARLLETAPAEDAGAARKVILLQSLSRLDVADAAGIITRFISDPNLRVGRCARRALQYHRQTHRRAAHSVDPKIPDPWHPQPGTAASLRRVVNPAPGNGQFERVWDQFAALPPAVQATTSRSLSSTDGEFSAQLKSKLSSGKTADLAQGLRMLGTLKKISAYRDQIITLCGHPDARVVATAVKLVGRLEDAKLGNLLEAAARHADARVRANAIESMEDLHIADRSTQLLSMLHSRNNRERANAIKAISTFDFLTARDCLTRMINDSNAHHRISALWVAGQLGMLDVVRQIASCARLDGNPRVRKMAREMLLQLNDAASVQAAKA